MTETREIKRICIYQMINYWYKDRENSKEDLESNSMMTYLCTTVEFYEDRIRINVDGKEKEQEVKDTYENVRSILENSENRYDKTIKNRNLRIQSFCISVGFIAYYIIYFIMLVKMDDIKNIDVLYKIITNKFAIVIIQWAIAIGIGNFLGSFFVNVLYKNILPERKYASYDVYANKSIYIDNIEEYISNDEVQIGKFFDSIARRAKIERIYKITKIVILAQIAISIGLLVIL